MVKIRLITKTGVRAYERKNRDDLIYVRKYKAYFKPSAQDIEDIKAGMRIQPSKSTIIGLQNVHGQVWRFERKEKIAGYSRTISDLKKSVVNKKPRMMSARIENALYSVREKTGLSNKEATFRMREYLKAKKKAIATGGREPRFHDYIQT